MKKIKTQADIRHAFFDPAHGSRIRLSAASLTNPFQAPILRQEVDHDPMPMDAYDGSSEQSRCDIVATNSSTLSPGDLPPLQLKANFPLQQVELETDERSQHIEELSVDKDTLRPGARAHSTWHRRRNVVYWNPNGRSSMISCAIKSFKRHSQGMSLFMVCVFVF